MGKTNSGQFKKGHIPWHKGKKLSIEIKRKIGFSNSISQKGKKLSEKTKLKISRAFSGTNHPMYGKKHKEESIKKMKKVVRTEEFKKHLSKINSGKNHPKYISDRTKLKIRDDRRSSSMNNYWRLQVFLRDNRNCKLLSDECSGRLEVHHIFNYTDYPELRFIINNGITLCAFHHPRGREEEKRMIPIFQELLSVSKD